MGVARGVVGVAAGARAARTLLGRATAPPFGTAVAAVVVVVIVVIIVLLLLRLLLLLAVVVMPVVVVVAIVVEIAASAPLEAAAGEVAPPSAPEEGPARASEPPELSVVLVLPRVVPLPTVCWRVGSGARVRPRA